MDLPDKFIERVRRIFPENDFERLKEEFKSPENFAVRMNVLKRDPGAIKERLQKDGLFFLTSPILEETLLFDYDLRRDVLDHDLVGDGVLYPQSLSSQLTARVLDPRPDQRVLDLCAAPGSKTSHIAAIMKNSGGITAVDAVSKRVYKLRTVLKLLGVTNTVSRCLDGRRYRDRQMFDRILVDAPCSAEARFQADRPKSYAFWSERKIREMSRKQKGLLLNASRLLAPGGVMVYSTCTFAPEENEAVVDWLLRKTEGKLSVESVDINGVGRLPTVKQWRKKEFNPETGKCLRICPGGGWEGFFIAKFRCIHNDR